MPKFEMRHQTDDEDTEPRELVGSKDLRESFKDKEHIRGSFFLNGVEMHQFEANSPASVCSWINEHTARTGVDAQIDDKGRLVLTNAAPQDIRIRLGAPYVEPEPRSTGDAAKDVLNTLKQEGEKRQSGRDKNTVLDDLGLKATEDDKQEDGPVRPGFETGASAEERKKAREARQKAAEQQGKSDPYAGRGIGNAGHTGTAGQGQTREPTQIPSAPITGGAQQGRLDDGRGRTGDGTGYSPRPDGGDAVRGTPANEGPQGADVAANQAPKAPEPV